MAAWTAAILRFVPGAVGNIRLGSHGAVDGKKSARAFRSELAEKITYLISGIVVVYNLLNGTALQ